MPNTSDTLGIQTTLDKLIAHELTSFEDDTVTTLRDNAFQYNDTIKLIKLPNWVHGNHRNMFQHCTSLETLDFSQQMSILTTNNWFNGDTRITHLILRSDSLCALSGSFSALFDSPNGRANIYDGVGAIYVPSELVDTYKSATNWSVVADQIHALEDYPITDFSTIKDDWDTIITKLENGTADYTVGDIKKMDYDGSTVYMQLVALDTDDLAAGGKAKSSWISLYTIENRAIQTGGTASDWASCDARAYLRETVFNKIPSNIRSAIKEVTKTYRTKTLSDATLSVSDTIWIPSCREIFGETSVSEESGAIYDGIFNSADSRSKRLSGGNKLEWWSRTNYTSTNYITPGPDGSSRYKSQMTALGLVLGFCI